MKETRITFRADKALKNKLEKIAHREGRSVSQVCDAFLRAGCAEYKKAGSRFLQRYLSRQDKEKTPGSLNSTSA